MQRIIGVVGNVDDVHVVPQPTITIYRPAKEKDTGAAMLICPGGGYHNLFWQLEGEEVAAWLNSIGLTGILLKYRVPRRPDDAIGEFPARRPLQDLVRRVDFVDVVDAKREMAATKRTPWDLRIRRASWRARSRSACSIR